MALGESPNRSGSVPPRAGAQGYTPLVTATGAKTAAPLHELAPPGGGNTERHTARAKRAAAGRRDLLRVQPLYVRHVPVTPLARRGFCQFLME